MHLERGNGEGPDNALIIMVLLDGGRHQASDTDAVGPHHRRFGNTVFIDKLGAHFLTVESAQFEDMPDLDAAGGREGAAAFGTASPALALAISWRISTLKSRR